MTHVNRRRFLKYAGSAVAVVGASALGLDYLANNARNQQTTQATRSSSSGLDTTSVSSTSSSSVLLVSLQGRLFFDYNGNGLQDAQEPAVSKAKVRLSDGTGRIIAEALSDSSGDYKLEDVPVGVYSLTLDTDNKFRHMCRSANEFRAISDGYTLDLNESSRLDVGFMEGFLTMPIQSSTKYTIMNWYDWDPALATYLWWNGESGFEADREGFPNHTGIDYKCDVGEDVIAPAPGITTGEEVAPTGQISTGIYHGDISLNGVKGRFYTSYNHLSKVLKAAGESVQREEKIAETGNTGPKGTIPHLHYNTAFEMVGQRGFLDFYEPIFPLYPNHEGFWTSDDQNPNSWLVKSPSSNPNGTNLWTRLNTPVFCK